MSKKTMGLMAASVAGAAVLALSTPSKADEVSDFYKGKTLTLIMSTGVGGGNDLNARTLLNYMVKYIPGKPEFKPVNMPGAGHVRATNFLYNRAPKDGTHLGAVIRFFVLHQALGGKGVKYDATKFNFVGSTTVSNVVLGAFHTAGINNFKDLKTKELIVGGTGVGSGSVIFPNLFNKVLGTKLKIVQGYKSGHTIDLAMERGEVQGRAGFTFDSMMAVHPTWMSKGTFKVLAQIGLRKETAHMSIPLAEDLVSSKEDKQVMRMFAGVVAVGSPIFTTPGVPKARVAALRNAFMATMKDKAYLARMKKIRLSVNPTNAVGLAKIVSDIVNAPSAVLDKAKNALSRTGLVKCKAFTSAKYCKKKKKKKGKKGKKKS
jgi:tripartite-type tricarboxylate transporter receptor subunit TctC